MAAGNPDGENKGGAVEDEFRNCKISVAGECHGGRLQVGFVAEEAY